MSNHTTPAYIDGIEVPKPKFDTKSFVLQQSPDGPAVKPKPDLFNLGKPRQPNEPDLGLMFWKALVRNSQGSAHDLVSFFEPFLDMYFADAAPQYQRHRINVMLRTALLMVNCDDEVKLNDIQLMCDKTLTQGFTLTDYVPWMTWVDALVLPEIMSCLTRGWIPDHSIVPLVRFAYQADDVGQGLTEEQAALPLQVDQTETEVAVEG